MGVVSLLRGCVMVESVLEKHWLKEEEGAETAVLFKARNLLSICKRMRSPASITESGSISFFWGERMGSEPCRVEAPVPGRVAE